VEGRPLDEADASLVARARRGDVAAFEEIVRRYQEVAFRVAYTITGSVTDAEDATQEGFIRAYRALHRFREADPLRPWLLTIVANAARTRRSVSARHPSLALSAAAAIADDRTLSPEAAALASERLRELLAAVETLSDTDRLVIACRYFLDLSEPEIATVLGCPRGTVKSRLSRALARLRRHLPTGAPRTVSGEANGNEGGRDV
jgi:RNA polymerase sigma-70 factor (ECF subfamily)